jgi:hypothetical protein
MIESLLGKGFSTKNELYINDGQGPQKRIPYFWGGYGTNIDVEGKFDDKEIKFTFDSEKTLTVSIRENERLEKKYDYSGETGDLLEEITKELNLRRPRTI